MNKVLEHLDKAFENKVRLGLMSLLMVNEKLDFSRIKELLQLTDGNLASHSKALEQAGYIQIEKRFIGKKPNTSYQATPEGRKAFQQHLQALENLIRQSL